MPLGARGASHTQSGTISQDGKMETIRLDGGGSRHSSNLGANDTSRLLGGPDVRQNNGAYGIGIDPKYFVGNDPLTEEEIEELRQLWVSKGRPVENFDSYIQGINAKIAARASTQDQPSTQDQQSGGLLQINTSTPSVPTEGEDGIVPPDVVNVAGDFLTTLQNAGVDPSKVQNGIGTYVLKDSISKVLESASINPQVANALGEKGAFDEMIAAAEKSGIETGDFSKAFDKMVEEGIIAMSDPSETKTTGDPDLDKAISSGSSDSIEDYIKTVGEATVGELDDDTLKRMKTILDENSVTNAVLDAILKARKVDYGTSSGDVADTTDSPVTGEDIDIDTPLQDKKDAGGLLDIDNDTPTPSVGSSRIPSVGDIFDDKTAKEVERETRGGGVLGVVGKGLDWISEFADKHPIISTVLVNGIISAFSDDEIDLLKEKEKYEQRDRDRQNQNRNVGVLNLGIGPGNKKLKDNSGNYVYTPEGPVDESRYGQNRRRGIGG